MSVWSWLRLTAALWLLRKGVKAFGWFPVAGVAVTAWPITTVAAIGYLAAWLREWPPARLWRAAAWALPMTAVYAIGQAIRLHAWQAVALAPVDDYGNAWRLLAARAILRAGLLVAPVAVPAGRAIGGLLWACGSTPSPPAWPGSPPPHRSSSTPGNGAARSAPHAAGPPPPAPSPS